MAHQPFECLENRILLSTVYDLPTKKITVTGTASNDVITISLSGGNTLSVVVNGVNEYNLAAANSASVLTLIEVQAGGGNDKVDLGTTTKAINTQTLINGSTGADTITGGAGPDEIYGSSGNDSIDGGLGNDSISGGADNDTVSYANRLLPVNVTLDGLANDGQSGEADNVGFGTTDVESIMGGSGNDTLSGNSLGNYISGGAGIDLIHGNAGSDTIVGGAGVDSLYGDADADFIFAKDGLTDFIDGGLGIDAVDADGSPIVEAPLPGSGLPGAAVVDVIAVSAPAVVAAASSKSPPVISLKPQLKLAPVMKPVAKAAGFSNKKILPKKVTSISAKPVVASAAPLPGPPDDPPNIPIDANNLADIISALDPYCKGQVLTTRDESGNVIITGTSPGEDPGDDVFILQGTGEGQPNFDIYNNGGFVRWDLSTPRIFVNGKGGNDTLIVTGPNSSGANYTPGNSTGSVASVDGHQIVFGAAYGLPPIPNLVFSDLPGFGFTTPGAQDALDIVYNADGSTLFSGQSDGAVLQPFTVANTQAYTLDLHTNAGNGLPSADTVNVSGALPAGVAPPMVYLAFANLGPDALNVSNAPLVLTSDVGSATTVNVTGAQSNVVFGTTDNNVGALNISGGAGDPGEQERLPGVADAQPPERAA